MEDDDKIEVKEDNAKENGYLVNVVVVYCSNACMRWWPE